ncbi:GNAT family N-acetyltransferase [Congregibacter variabilis]|uniref:GNAT family N-acetyltransferase n=1 Tax=Congregibacter variabilis TaxID=3081200 RepID=A0ABZ0I6Z1_9GAMM|nr:GNAT family N-acetyltransferase [Congregibacter sp. IMCC43200]
MAIFGTRLERRRSIWASRVCHLHQSGHAQLDQIWIEYNGPLTMEPDPAACLNSLTSHLLSTGASEEVHLSMIPLEHASSILTMPYSRILQRVTGWQRDLQLIRDNGGTVLSAFSSNTRQQIKRSLQRYVELHGKQCLVEAKDKFEAVSWLEQAAHWHQDRWPDSGFSNEEFVLFHRKLILRTFSEGGTRIFRVTFGDHTIGYFYFLTDGMRVYFYLQAIEPPVHKHLKPGLVGHAMLMQHFLDEGAQCYDFMGGDSQYKRQLADKASEFVVVRVHNGALKYRVEDWIRRLRDAARSVFP